MHELPITENILNITLRHAKKSNAKHVKGLHLVIGQFASIIDDSVQFYWDIIAKGTIAEGASLNFRRIKAKFLCLSCDYEFSYEENFCCPHCSSNKVKLLSGDEFFLEAIDIET